MNVTQSADRLVVSYPLWIGVALLLAAAAFLACAVVVRKRIRRRWTVGVATVVAAWAGLYFLTFNATITRETGTVYGFLRYDHSIRWQDAVDIYLEQRGGNWQIVVRDTQRRAFDFDVADLSIDDRDRVMAYMVDRMPDTAFPRAPALMKRHGSLGTRPVGLFSDQQI